MRIAADRLALAYNYANVVVNEWFATSMSAKITNTSDTIIDGAAQDGRTPITGADATNVDDLKTSIVHMIKTWQ